MTIKAIILDLDGVITDTAEYHYRAWKRLADDEGVPFDREANDALRGVSRRASLELLMGEAIARYSEEQNQEMMARKTAWPKTRFGDGYNPEHVESIQRLTKRF